MKIMNKSEAELNKTMGNLDIGPKVIIAPRIPSNSMYNVIMDKLKGDTLKKLWPKMEFEAKKNAALQMKAIIEKAGKKGYKLTDNNATNCILNDGGVVTRIDFDDVHVQKIEQGGEEKAVKEPLGDAQSAFEMEGIDDDIWKYLPKEIRKEISSPGI